MEGRALGTPGNARARAFIVQRFRESGLVPMPAFGDRFEQPLRSGARLPVNVVGLVRGRVVPDRFLVVSAHYDHIGVRGGVVYNGADDNASGTAALFAVARHFTAHPPAHSLIIVAFDGEEAGNLGSQGFVAAPPVPLDALLVDLNADMLARDPRRILFVTGTRLFPAFRPLIEAAARGASVTVRTGHDGVGGEEDWIRDSDQYAFIQAGVPALYLGVEDYAFHHAPTDDADSIMPDFYVGAVEALIGMVGVFDAHGPLLEQVRGETPPRRGGR
jgi:Zn-dependent M28 family amino/carboxypeptidase